MSLAMISKNLWEKYKMKFLFLKQEVVFFSPASLDESEGISDFTSVLPRGRTLNILYHIFAHYLLFNILRAYMYSHAHTHITVVICK